MIGKEFNYWTVIGEPVRFIKPSGQVLLKIPCRCICGKEKLINKYSLTSGRSLSCSCMTTGTHRETGTRLYHCWENMKQRSRRRTLKGEVCEVCDEWQTYEGFKQWALNNGYEDGLELMRGTYDNPDTGNYCPENARWGTHKENAYDYFRKVGYR